MCDLGALPRPSYPDRVETGHVGFHRSAIYRVVHAKRPGVIGKTHGGRKG